MNSNKAIKNIFAGDQTKQTRAQVVGKVGGGVWKVRDDTNRLSIVSSDQEWSPGIDWVIIQAGRIVARSSVSKKINTYEV